MNLKYKDADDDLISIRKDGDLRNAIKTCGGKVLRVHCSERHKSQLSKSETAVLETLVDGVVIIDKHCSVMFFNKSAERIFGYDRSEVTNQNVKMLMPPEIALNHDSYIASYLKTCDPKIIGKGRNVVGKRKDGSTVSLFLSLSEHRTSGRHTFTGTIQELQGRAVHVDSGSVSYAILQNILDVAIVIEEKGVIQYINKQATNLLGYQPTDVVGKNIKMLMPSPYKDNHDQFLLNYLTTNQPKVIGKGRDVLAQCKDGSIIPVNLSLTEQRISDTSRIFTGILRRVEEEKSSKSVLQQEREVIDNLIIPAIIIDERGLIQAFNKPCQELFGYTIEEVIGKNIKTLMPSPDREKHDAYIKAYVTTGRSKVIGVGRDVVGQHKTGAMLPIRLSVTVKKDGDKRIFTGVLQKL